MGKISLLDCTLRDGGYVNNWEFGIDVIEKCIDNLEKSLVDIIEIGFLKNEEYKEARTVYNNVDQITKQIAPKKPHCIYAGMIEVVSPIPLEMLAPCSSETIDMIRVIVWKTKRNKEGTEIDALQEGFRYCKGVIEKGYKLSVQPARVDQYSEEEFVNMVKLFNELDPYAFYIVDSWGTQTPEQIMNYANLADKILKPQIALGFHGHDNMSMALDIAKAFCGSGLNRDLIIDSSVNGIGRGAGNLDSAEAAQFLNQNYRKNYAVPYLEYIGDTYIAPIFMTHKWGHTLPFYMTAVRGCNPNYANYYDFELGLAAEDIEGILDIISDKDKIIYSEEKAKKYLRSYRKKQLDLVIVIPTCDRCNSIDYLLFKTVNDLWLFGIDIVIYDSSCDNRTEAVVKNFILDGYNNVFYKRYTGVFDGFSLDNKVMEAYREHLNYKYIWVMRDGLVPTLASVYDEFLKIFKDNPDIVVVDASFRNNGDHYTKEYDECSSFFLDNMARATVLGCLIFSSHAAGYMVDHYPLNETTYSLWSGVVPFHYFAEKQIMIMLYISDIFEYNIAGTKNLFWNKAGKAFDQWCYYWDKVINALPSVYDKYKPIVERIEMYDFYPFNMESLLRMRGNGGLDWKLIQKYKDIIPKVCNTSMWKFKLAAAIPKSLARWLVVRPHWRMYNIYQKLIRM